MPKSSPASAPIPFGWLSELVHTASGDVAHAYFSRTEPQSGPQAVGDFSWRITPLFSGPQVARSPATTAPLPPPASAPAPSSDALNEAQDMGGPVYAVFEGAERVALASLLENARYAARAPGSRLVACRLVPLEVLPVEAQPSPPAGPLTDAPKSGEPYWDIHGGMAWERTWSGLLEEWHRFESGLLFHTEADALAALEAEESGQ